MKLESAIIILKSLANGENPQSGEIFPPGSPYQHPKTVRALLTVLNSLPQQKPKRKQLPKQSVNDTSFMVDSFDYSKIFELAEKALIQYGAKRKNKSDVLKELSAFYKIPYKIPGTHYCFMTGRPGITGLVSQPVSFSTMV